MISRKTILALVRRWLFLTAATLVGVFLVALALAVVFVAATPDLP